MHEYTQMQVRTTVAMDTEQYGHKMQDCACRLQVGNEKTTQ